MQAMEPIDFDCLHRQTLVFLMAGERTVRLSVNVRVCLCSFWFLDQAGLDIRVAAWGAAEQQLLLVDQGVQQVLLSVVVVDLQKGHHCDAQPGEPGSPQAELRQRNHCKYKIQTCRCLHDHFLKGLPEL